VTLRACLELAHASWATGDPIASMERTLALARMADAAGFDSLWISEDPDGWDAFALLGAIARETSTIRLGTGVTNAYLRHPRLIAASVATLDRLSRGRAFLGIGRGQPEWYRAGFETEIGSPLERMASTVDLVRQWWRPPHLASADGAIPVRDWRLAFGPIAQPPVYLAATGPRALTLAGRVADGVRFNELASVEYLCGAIAQVRSAAADAGRDPAALAFFVHPSVVVTDDPEPVLARKKLTIALIHALPGMEAQLRTPGIDVDGIMSEVRRHMRTEDALARGLGFAEMRAAGDVAAAKRAIPLELMERVAVVGPAHVVRARLAEIAAAGATHVFLDIDRLPDDPSAMTGLLAAIRPEVA
jgi:5,10-methylenetetrahydromethanopterin reductase